MARIIIEAVDPRKRIFILYKERYDQHIALRHPDIQLNWIQTTIEQPSFIFQDATNKLREVFYKIDLFAMSSLWMRVVVEKNEIITAFRSRGGKDGEKLIWKPSK